MKLIIFIPALNEEGSIKETIQKIPRMIEGIDQMTILVVDDGSNDRTALFAEEAGAVVISHTRNKGVGGAFHTAVQYSLENRAEILVGIDADGQFDPNEIPKLIAPILKREADMVIGNRFENGLPEKMPLVKFVGNKIISRLVSKISGQYFTDVSCGFRAYDREALFRFNIYGQFTYTHETILSSVYQGLRVLEIPIKVKYYHGRKSRVAGSIYRYAVQTSKILLRVLLDYRPLLAFGTTGGLSIGIGTFFGIYLIVHYLMTGNFTPYKSFGFIALGFGIFGLVILVIALIADMLNRMKTNQDKILYELKTIRYSKNGTDQHDNK